MRAAGPRLCSLVLLALAVATAADAGAWPREERTFFVSTGAEAVSGEGLSRTFYLEYGLTARLTIGADGWLKADRTDGAGFAFARLPLAPADSPNQFAAGLGFGALLLDDGTPVPAARATLHWGRGLTAGWLALDAEVATALDTDARSAKLEATWGRRLAEDWSAILQVAAGSSRDGETYAGISPSITWQASERATLRLGLSRPLSDEGTGIAAQLWLTF